MAKLTLCEVRGLLNQLNDVLSGEEDRVWFQALKRFLRKENPWPLAEPAVSEPATVQFPLAPPVQKRWRDMGDHLILTVVVDRVSTGEEWICRTDTKGNRSDPYAKKVLRSKKFQTTPVGTYEVAVLKGTSFTSDPTTKQVCAWGKEKKFSDPNSDIACFIREQYTDDELNEMGLWWIAVMHKPIVSVDFSRLLTVHRDGGGRLLRACDGYPDDRWSRRGGFAFLVSQVSLSA
jgi:hypothetical protein